MNIDYSLMDIFGIGIGLRYLNKTQFQTKFGGMMTLMIGLLICVEIVLVGKELVYKSNPEVIFSEKFVASPARFTLEKQTFNLAFGARLPGINSHFIDESIYTLEAQQVSMQKVFNETSNTYDQKWQFTPLIVSACAKSNFQVADTLEYFTSLAGLEQMYCIDQTQQNIFLEGSFDQAAYGYIRISLKICKDNPNCKSPNEIKNILTNSIVAIYTDDIIIDPKKINPFATVGREFIWYSSPEVTKEVTMYYRNVYVQNDKGILFQESDYENSTVFSYQNEQMMYGENDFYFSMVIRLEQSKESVYHRKYKKLDTVLAEIGGITKALIMIGFVICLPINRLRLQWQLSNSLFSFRSSNRKDIYFNVSGQKEIRAHQLKQEQISSQLRDTEQIKSPSGSIHCKRNDPASNNDRIIDCDLKSPNLSIKSKRESVLFDISCQQEYKSDKPDQNLTRLEKIELKLKENLKKSNEESYKKEKSAKTYLEFKGTNINDMHLNKQKSLEIQKNMLELKGTDRKDMYPNKEKSLENTNNTKNMLNNTKDMEEFPMQLKKEKRVENAKDMEEFPMQIKKEKSVEIAKTTKNMQQFSGNNNINDIQLKKRRFQSILNVKELFKDPEKDDSLQLKWSDFLRYCIWPFSDLTMKKEINVSVENIYKSMDMLYIVKKLNEIERLKQLLFDQDQIKLIQFLPKPMIDMDEIEQSKQNNTYSPSLKKFNLLSDFTSVSEKERTQQAFQALKNIIKKNTLSEIDRKIINMIDGNILENIESNVQSLSEFSQKDTQKESYLADLHMETPEPNKVIIEMLHSQESSLQSHNRQAGNEKEGCQLNSKLNSPNISIPLFNSEMFNLKNDPKTIGHSLDKQQEKSRQTSPLKQIKNVTQIEPTEQINALLSNVPSIETAEQMNGLLNKVAIIEQSEQKKALLKNLPQIQSSDSIESLGHYLFISPSREKSVSKGILKNKSRNYQLNTNIQ